MKSLIAILVLLVGSTSSAGLVIHTAEMGIGKFHRMDNKAHTYSLDNAWKPFILADNAPTVTPVIQNNADGSVTIFYSSLLEMLTTATKIAADRGEKISALNINAHGLPGGMWFPKSAKQRDSFECRDWRSAAAAPDKTNYDQYYSPISKSEILQLKATAQFPAHYSCVVGLPEWREITAQVPNLKSYFSNDAQVHFLSCLVGYGPVGESYTAGIAGMLMDGTQAALQTSLKFGLGDWSMPEGMGFWDYINDQQLAHDNSIYPVNRRDRDIMQTGGVRVAHGQNGIWSTSIVTDQSFMVLGPLSVPQFSSEAKIISGASPTVTEEVLMPTEVRIPGTGVKAIRIQ
jgi:hypothetical protein